MIRTFLFMITFINGISLLALPAQAAVITGVANGVEVDGKFTVEGPGGEAAAEIDGKLIIDKVYDSVDPIDIKFEVDGSSGEDSLYGVIEFFHNSTGQDWDDYHLELGYGGFDNATDSDPFVQSSDEDELYFVPPLEQVLPVFDTVMFMDNAIWLEDGIFPADASNVMFYQINVPGADSVPNARDGFYEFTLRQYPSIENGAVIPEPSTLFLLGLGWLGAAGARRKLR
ncbi:MAG: PEP-CTERM sorting domain-containing protein [Candidatus Omnitrophica bacterium]|nr:PEP-CTERM sorting domain-containing protein [Candidatus Omnitrophota bacterium]